MWSKHCFYLDTKKSMKNKEFQEMVTSEFKKNKEFQEMAMTEFKQNRAFQEMVISEFKKNNEFQEMMIQFREIVIEQFQTIEGQFQKVNTTLAYLQSGQERLWEKVHATAEDLEYLKKKVDHIETQQDTMFDSIKFIEERTRKDDDALVLNFFRLEKRVTKLETQPR